MKTKKERAMSDNMDLETAIANESGKNETYALQGHFKVEQHIQDDEGFLCLLLDGVVVKRENRAQVGKAETIENAIIEIDTSTTGYAKFIKAYYNEDELPDNNEFLAFFPFPICDYARLEFSLTNDELGRASFGKAKFRIMSEGPEKIALSLRGKKISFDLLPSDFEEKHQSLDV